MAFLRGDAAVPSFRRMRLCAFGAVVAGFVVAAAGAYRFYPDDQDTLDPLTPLAADAARWDPAVWGPGETLEWFIVGDDPGWEAIGVSPEEARRPIERALARWAAVPGADIRWRLGGMTTEQRQWDEFQNTVKLAAYPDGISYASMNFRRNDDSIWELHRCRVVLSYRSAAELSSDSGQLLLTHEFGHCLGLDHTWAHWLRETPDLWGASPTMSYGPNRDMRLLPDDHAGARLLRPDLTTRNDDGSIAGEVTVLGDPAAYVYVVVSPTFGPERQGVGAFTDDRGRFEIEGLRPGSYRLRASPIQMEQAHPLLSIRGGATLDAGDALALGPIDVRAGEVTGLVRLDLVRLELPDRLK